MFRLLLQIYGKEKMNKKQWIMSGWFLIFVGVISLAYFYIVSWPLVTSTSASWALTGTISPSSLYIIVKHAIQSNLIDVALLLGVLFLIFGHYEKNE
jgi:hypothetical protein